MNDYAGKPIDVGDLVAYTRMHYSGLYKGRVTKICDKVIRVSVPTKHDPEATTTAEPRCVIVLAKAKEPRTPLDETVDEILSKYNIMHGDDRSAIIFKALWCRLNDKPIRIEEEAAFYIRYWADKGLNPDGSPKISGAQQRADFSKT